MTLPNLEQLTAAQKANTEVATALWRTSIEGVQRLAELNLEATRDFFNVSVANASTLFSAKDPNLAALNQQLAKPGFDKLMDYSRQVYDLVTDLQREVTEVVQTQYGQFSQEAVKTIDKTRSPIGSDIFSAAMRGMFEQTNKAFESMNAATRQMTANLHFAGNGRSPAAPRSPA